MPARSTAALTAIAPNCVAGTLLSDPWNFPTGVRAAERMTASSTGLLRLFSFTIVPPLANLRFNYKAYTEAGMIFKAAALCRIYYNPDMADFELSLYEMIGGETGLRSLVERFYDLMDSAVEAEKIRSFHPKSLKQSREKLFMFLSGWSGGPQLYIKRFGHPRLRMRHMPFVIGSAERDQWLWCMNKALEDSQIDPRLVEFLKTRFTEVADAMRNQIEG
jgi:hemoglobin